ncbi:MAG: hypothetical protein EXR05_08895 [Acetobacteraceae bacterium]|nr:hypothetical protein [Acetobacteraceae bacterium]
MYALQATLPRLTRLSPHRCLPCHGIARLANPNSAQTAKKRFKADPIGYFHNAIAEIRTEQGELYLLVSIDRTSKLACVELRERVT